MVLRPAVLTVVEGEGAPIRVDINQSPFTIGRASECDLTLGEAGLSRLHARIERAYGQYTLEDMGSTNGTFVNDRAVTEPTPLYNGDVIRLARAVRLRFEDPSATDQIDVSDLGLGGLQINRARKETFVDGRLVEPPLSPSQYALLELLVDHEGQIVTREEIAGRVWPDEQHITDQMIDTLVSRLRKRLSPYGVEEQIVTRRGFGLLFTRE